MLSCATGKAKYLWYWMCGATSFHAKWLVSMTSVGDFSASLLESLILTDLKIKRLMQIGCRPPAATNEDRYWSITSWPGAPKSRFPQFGAGIYDCPIGSIQQFGELGICYDMLRPEKAHVPGQRAAAQKQTVLCGARIFQFLLASRSPFHLLQRYQVVGDWVFVTF